jgi:putative endonuclease
MDKTYYVYILASKRNGTLYTGVTSDLVRRVCEHRCGLTDGFTKLYKVHDLVYFEGTPDATAAIQRERQIKKWNRKWKLELIEKYNPECETYTMVWYSQHWIPVFTGMTSKSCDRSCVPIESGRVTWRFHNSIRAGHNLNFVSVKTWANTMRLPEPHNPDQDFFSSPFHGNDTQNMFAFCLPSARHAVPLLKHEANCRSDGSEQPWPAEA